MNTTSLEPLLKNATIKAIDSVAKKLTDVEAEAETKISRLLKHWNEMEPAEKEHAVGIAIAAVTTVVTAIMALRRKSQSTESKMAKKLKRMKK